MNVTASMLERIDLCPGSLQLEQGLADRVTGAAVDGIYVHTKLAAHFRGEPCEFDDTPGSLDSLARGYIAEAQHIIEEYTAGEEVYTALVEERIKCIDGYSGQPDLVILWEFRGNRFAIVFDWKSGWIEQELSPRNLQGRAYAVLVALAHQCSAVFVAILQRNAETLVTRYDLRDLIKAREQIIDIIREGTAPGAVRTPGKHQCRYCKALANNVCPEAQETIGESLAVMAYPGSPPSALSDPASVKGIAKRLSAEQLIYIHDRKTVAGLVFQAVDEEIKARLKEDSSSVPGLALKPGNTCRQIEDVAGACLALQPFVTIERFLKCCTVRIGDIEGAFREANGGTWAASNKELSKVLEPYITKTQNQPSIVKAKS